MPTSAVRAGCPLPALTNVQDCILEALAEGGRLTMNELVRAAGYSRRTLFRNFSALRESGLIRVGPGRRYYRTDMDPGRPALALHHSELDVPILDVLRQASGPVKVVIIARRIDRNETSVRQRLGTLCGAGSRSWSDVAG